MVEIDEQYFQLLKFIESDYGQLKKLIDDASENKDIDRYGDEIVLYADSVSLQILDANPQALAFLGFSKEQLQNLSIETIEVNDKPDIKPITYVESSQQEQIYTCSYRHQDGYLLPVRVHKRWLTKDQQPILRYTLEEQSLKKRLWYELRRREDAGYQFQQKLKILNEINIDLSRIESLDSLCWHGIKLGVERLGFERLSMWFLDATRNVMVGSYGIDEDGEIRNEQDQSWNFAETPVIDFMAGKTEPVLKFNEAPLYNHKSQILSTGWHISVPMLNGNQLIGFMAADNFLHHQPMKPYAPELLRLFGMTLGHLIALTQARTQALELRFEQARVQMLKTFITDVSHDFRTPLTIINTNSYLLHKLKDDDRKKVLINTIQEQNTYIGHMIDDMLEVVRLKSDLVLESASVELQLLVQEVIRSHQTLAATKSIQLHFQSKKSVVIKADIYYLKQALSKLVTNAIKYTPTGGEVNLSIHIYPHEIGIRVTDTGAGIEEAHLDKIFKPHHKVNEARTEMGSGLGLTIAKIIVEAHQGRILVESSLGSGSTFEIILPFA